jgi:hypothetical protein
MRPRPSCGFHFYVYLVSPIDGSFKKRIVILSRVNLWRSIILSVLSLLALPAVLATARAQVTPSKPDAASLQKKAIQAQAWIQAKENDRDELKRAIKTNEVTLAKQVLLRNGFTADDLENAKITLRTGGGKGVEDEIEISATCCDPKEITIQRSAAYFTK